ncbi:MAG TPA: MFS transporter [Chloroflexi bacterium]|nr:MFS transporter [Chloroflexota bacterium]
MFKRWRKQVSGYPAQFWLMFWGMLMSTVGASMIWPFLMIYVSERVQRPLGQIGSLMTLNAAVGVGAALWAGPLTDRLGRKGVMVFSLIGNGMVYLLMGQAHLLWHFALLMSFWGFFGPMYRVGGDAMLADLVPPERRPDAYALLRMSNNVGVAVGPAVGGFLAAASYGIAFLFAAAGLAGYGLLLAFFARETLPQSRQGGASEPLRVAYRHVLRDGRFLRFAALFVTAQSCAVLIWVLMGVYAKTQYGVPENHFGLIATTNATLVVLFQFAVTQRTKRHAPLRMMALGTLFYALGVGSVALARGFWGFWVSMVIYTLGEMILIPTASAYVANLAPAEMRGRYMSVYGLGWNVASGIATPLGGFLSDIFGPVSTWYGGLLIGLAGAAGYLRLDFKERKASST